ncbi:MAG: DUF4388 domain-containing protein [Deltaproteobacteria bacterium]|nr:DUF4388 domain-containing protein [Deltaproteobacteria bacterium]
MDPKSTALVAVSADGSLEAQGSSDRATLGRRAGQWAVHFLAEDVGLLVADEPEGLRSRVVLAGEVVSRTSVTELLGAIASFAWTGELRIVTREVGRTAIIDRGIVTHASSDAPEDRLGELLVRLGVVDRGMLSALVGDLGPSRRMGRLMVERGLLTESELFKYLQLQAKEIVFGMLQVHEGVFAFLGRPDLGPLGPLVHLPLQAILLEGVQRIDEMQLFRSRIPSREVVVEAQAKRGLGDSNPGARPSIEPLAIRVLSLCDGKASIEDMMRELQMDEFEVTRVVYHLLTGGHVQIRQSGTLRKLEVDEASERFGAILKLVFDAANDEGKLKETRETLRDWLGVSGFGGLVEGALRDDGTLDSAVLAQTLDQPGSEQPIESLHRTLHELVCFALFSATASLPRERELALSREVNNRLAQLKL